MLQGTNVLQINQTVSAYTHTYIHTQLRLSSNCPTSADGHDDMHIHTYIHTYTALLEFKLPNKRGTVTMARWEGTNIQTHTYILHTQLRLSLNFPTSAGQSQWQDGRILIRERENFSSIVSMHA